MAKKPRAAILSGFGLNCEYETAHAFSLAGANAQIVHFNTFLSKSSLFEEFEIFAIPGGWSFADDIQSGRVLANKFKFRLGSPFKKFVESGKPVLGICNGFQALVQLGALPGWDDWNGKKLTLMHNRSGRFINKWVRLRAESSVCPYAGSMQDIITLPIRHGEGQVVLQDAKTLDALCDNRQIVFRYAAPDGLKAQCYPDNPNGSADSIAGICNEAGNVVGMMPHPECHIRYLQNPFWTANPPSTAKKGALSRLLSGISKKRGEDFGNCAPFFEEIVKRAKAFC